MIFKEKYSFFLIFSIFSLFVNTPYRLWPFFWPLVYTICENKHFFRYIASQKIFAYGDTGCFSKFQVKLKNLVNSKNHISSNLKLGHPSFNRLCLCHLRIPAEYQLEKTQIASCRVIQVHHDKTWFPTYLFLSMELTRLNKNEIVATSQGTYLNRLLFESSKNECRKKSDTKM